MTTTIFQKHKEHFDRQKVERLSIEEYLNLCKENPKSYDNVYERLLEAIGEPLEFDTAKDDRLGRIFLNRKIKVYKEFKDFYGIENVVEQLVAFLRSAASGMEESKAVAFLLGPVGSSKSSLVERLKELIQKIPFYSIEAFNHARNKWEVSPCYESPLGLFPNSQYGDTLEDEYNISKRYTKFPMSPWAVKRLREAGEDLDSNFRVIKLWPSILDQIGVTKIEPGDENNQDISAFVGKVNIRELENFSQSDPDAYNFSGGLNVTTQGLLDVVELFKCNLKTLNPILTATQENYYNPTEQIGALPYQGLILGHCNLTEWNAFKNDKKNEAFLDRISVIKVPYCLRSSEEVQIYQKLVGNSQLKTAPIAPGTLEMLARYSVFTRLKDVENCSIFTKMEIYDGKNMKTKDPSAKSIEEFRDLAGIDEGMAGSSTRFAYKTLSKVFYYDNDEIAANPVHLMMMLEKNIMQEALPKEEETRRLTFINETLKTKFIELLEKDIQQAFLDNASDFMQNIFERYINYADHWIQDKDYRDNDTGELYDREALDAELEKIEKPADIANPKDFRNEVVNFVLRAKANNNGKMIQWNSYEKMREVIERKVFSSVEELMPIISFSKKGSEEDQKKHNAFLKRMETKGYTPKQTRILVEYFMRSRKHN